MPRRRVALLCAAAAAITAMALPAGAQAQGQGKKIMHDTARPGSVIPTASTAAADDPDAASRRWATRSTGRTATGARIPERSTSGHHRNHPKRTRGSSPPRTSGSYSAIVPRTPRETSQAASRHPGRSTAPEDALIGYLHNGGGIAGMHNMTDAAPLTVTWDWWDGGPNSVIGTTTRHSANRRR